MNKNLVKFSMLIYIVFLLLFCCTGIVNTFITKNQVVMQIMTTICSWTAFYVLMAMFPKLMPGKTRMEFFRGLFTPKLDWPLLIGIVITQSLLFIVSVFVVSFKFANFYEICSL